MTTKEILFTKEQLLGSSPLKRNMTGHIYRGVLSKKEQETRLQEKGRVTVNVICTVGFDPECYFFTDDYCFGTDVLPRNFVHSFLQLPMNVAPRAGLEDGIVDTIEKYQFIFQAGDIQIESLDELVRFMNEVWPDLEAARQASIKEREEKKLIEEQQRLKRTKPKFQPEHFPRGTECVIKVTGQPARTMKVKYVVCNGWNSYLVTAGQFDEHGIPDSVNINWVESITHRGTEGMHWDKPLYPPSLLNAPDVKRKAKSRYITHSLSDVIQHLLRNEPSNTTTFDGDQMRVALGDASFVRFVSHSPNEHLFWNGHFEVNKKRAKRWFQQNKNRFIVSASEARRREEEYGRMYDDISDVGEYDYI